MSERFAWGHKRVAMNKLKVSTRLTILVSVLLLLLVSIGGLGLYGLEKSNDAQRTMFEDRTVPAGQLGEIKSLLLRNRLAIAIAIVTPTPDVLKERADQVDSNIAAITKIWNAYAATQMTVQEARLGKAFAEHRAAFVQEGLLPAVAAMRVNDMSQVRILTEQKIRSLFAPLDKDIDALVTLQVDEAKSDFDESTSSNRVIRNVAVCAIVVGALFAAIFGFSLVRSIRRELGAEPVDASNLARTVAVGDLSLPIDIRDGDTNSLMVQLKAMQSSLAMVVYNVRQNAESVATAAAQIAQGNNDLSSRTEQQAAALEQTAASMEQLSAAVTQNADHAKQANQLANDASQVAAKGGEVVGRAVETMKEINSSSKRIADIIGVIDGIAFQTNILALNAAVEAARAGEQGRGFAVVASEVRSLAGRSAEAAREIKSLITSSVERVEHGTALVDQAGATMNQVVHSIKRVTDIMGEISIASSQQSDGVLQVGEAVSQMDQATQQNAALVEQSAAAAESLKVQAQQLVRAVAVFKLAPA